MTINYWFKINMKKTRLPRLRAYKDEKYILGNKNQTCG